MDGSFKLVQCTIITVVFKSILNSYPVLNCMQVIHMLQRPSPKSILKMFVIFSGP